MTDPDAGAQQFLPRRAQAVVTRAAQRYRRLTALTHAVRRLVEGVAEPYGKIATSGAEGSASSPAGLNLTGLGVRPQLAQDVSSDPGRARREIAVVIPSPLGVPVGGDAPSIGQLLVQRRATRTDDVTLAVMQQGEGDARPLGEILVEHGATTAAQVVDALQAQAKVKRSADVDTSRADRDLLSSLPRLLAEIVEVRDGIRSCLEVLDDAAMHRSLQRLDAVAAEIEDKLGRRP